MTTVNDFTDILRIIREQPEWGDALRGVLLSQKLLELPERFAEFAETANKRFAALESDVTDLKAGQARLESAVSQLRGQVGNLRGSSYQLNVKTKIASIMTQRWGVEEIRVLKGSLAADDNVFFRLLLNAVAQGVISEQERREVLNADIILQGERQSDQGPLYMVLEVSITVAGDDITRAQERADILARATGEETTPAVVSAHADNTRQQLAQDRNVTLIAVSE